MAASWKEKGRAHFVFASFRVWKMTIMLMLCEEFITYPVLVGRNEKEGANHHADRGDIGETTYCVDR